MLQHKKLINELTKKQKDLEALYAERDGKVFTIDKQISDTEAEIADLERQLSSSQQPEDTTNRQTSPLFGNRKVINVQKPGSMRHNINQFIANMLALGYSEEHVINVAPYKKIATIRNIAKRLEPSIPLIDVKQRRK